MAKQQHDFQKRSDIKDYILKDYWDKKERLDYCLLQEVNQYHVSQEKSLGQILCEIFSLKNS